MSTRAHVITRYEILYGSEGLAWGQDLLESLADEYIEDSYTGGEYHSEEAIWEFNKEQFKAMTETLANMTKREYNRKCKEWGVKPKDYPKDEVVELFRTWLKETPEHYNNVRISWF